MGVLTPLLNMDDNMGLGTPNFFSSAWDPEQNDFSSTGGYQSNIDNYSSYAPQLRQGQAENNHLDYFSQSHDQLTSQSLFQPKYPSRSQNYDLDMILAPSEPAQPQPFPKPPLVKTAMQSIAGYENPTVFGVAELEGLSSSKWSSMAKSTAPVKLKTELTDDTSRRTSFRYGQITPGDSPTDNAQSAAQKERKSSTAKGKHDDSVVSNTPLKVKKPRKSKKMSLTKEQEETKRRKFLERNRVAADKCRQNRKKWINDLQAKVHFFNNENSTKRAAVEELELEIAQLRSLIFIHARDCKEKDILEWAGQESGKMEVAGQPKVQPDDAVSMLSQEFFDPCSPSSRPSTRGFSSVSDAVSRRYSLAMADDVVTSPMMESSFSGSGTRRHSFAA